VSGVGSTGTQGGAGSTEPPERRGAGLADAGTGSEPGEPVCVADFERLAEERVPENVWCYFAGGAADEVTLRANVAAYGRWRLRPRVLAGIGEWSTEAEVLGARVSMPILVAPTALQALLTPEGERASARAAAAAGTICCVSSVTTCTHEEIRDAAPEGPRWQQLYVLTDRGRSAEMIAAAAELGYSAIVLTADTPLWGRRERDLRLGFAVPPELPLPYVGADPAARLRGIAYADVEPALTWRDVEWAVEQSRLPVLVKGVLTGEDAVLAVEHGAAAVVVSNHGGRQLDGVAASLDALPEVVDAVAARVPVLLDGGVRRGTDALKALALGADAVLVGRPILYGLAVAGEAGALRVLELLREELRRGLALLGCASPEAVARSHVERAVPYDPLA
jgi:isopentenyl diphosphate isomerase/L-lactate dehydrogenase-like FMN-dependent dehydrogenase